MRKLSSQQHLMKSSFSGALVITIGQLLSAECEPCLEVCIRDLAVKLKLSLSPSPGNPLDSCITMYAV